MPNFSVETWTSFKQQFQSVIQFIMYCFDLCFDSFRSNPLLYIAFFFPIFALAFLFMFDLLFNLVPFSPLLSKSKNISVLGDGSFGNFKSSVSTSRNLANRINPVNSGVSGGYRNSVSYGSSGGSINSENFAFSGGSGSGSKITGTDFKHKIENAKKLKDKFKEWNDIPLTDEEFEIMQSISSVDKNEQFDRNFDERADRNQYRIR